jgi:hypothetical protein
MDATSNFSLRFAQASGSKAGLPERLLRRQALERIVTGLSLISQGLAFSSFGMLIIGNRHQADLNAFAGGGFWLRFRLRPSRNSRFGLSINQLFKPGHLPSSAPPVCLEAIL